MAVILGGLCRFDYLCSGFYYKGIAESTNSDQNGTKNQVYKDAWLRQ